MVADRLDEPTKSTVVGRARADLGQRRRAPGRASRRRRARQAARQGARSFSCDSSKLWDVMRAEMIGARTDLLALLDLLDDNWVVGDLGCGAGHIAEALAPCVAQGRSRWTSRARCSSRARRAPRVARATSSFAPAPSKSLPIDDGALDAAMLFLVAHFITDPAQGDARDAARAQAGRTTARSST